MQAIHVKNIDIVSSELSSDPLKQLVVKRLLSNLSLNINSISLKQVNELLVAGDVDFNLQIGNILAEQQVNNKEIYKQSISNNKKIQSVIQNLEKAGGYYSSKNLENILNISKAAITNRKSRNDLFSVKVGGKVYFPKFQFSKDMEVVKPFKEVLEILADKDPIASLFFLFETSNNHQDEEKPIYEILKDETQKQYILSIIKKRARALHRI